MARPEGQTNAVIRLNDILLNAQRRKTTTTDGKRELTCREVWCDVFELDGWQTEESLLQVQSRLLELRALFQEVICVIESVDELDEELYLTPLKMMSGIASDLNTLGHSWSSKRQVLSPENMTALRFIEDQVTRLGRYNETAVSRNELLEILETSQKLYAEITNSKLPKALKSVLLDILKELQDAIHEYNIRGPKRLKKAIGRAVGELVTNYPEPRDQEVPDAVKEVAHLVQRVEQLYMFATKAKALYDVVALALPILGATSGN